MEMERPTNDVGDDLGIDYEEGWSILEKQAQLYLKMGAKEFVSAWKAGKFKGQEDTPNVLEVAMLLPLIEEAAA